MIETSDIGKVQQGGGVNSPTSGTYGEKADVARLQASLPQAGGQPAQQAAPSMPPFSSTPVRPTAPSAGGTQAPPGVPAARIAPTQMPNEPVFTPPSAGVAPVQAQSAAERRIATLSMLAENPNVSDETREWAALVLRALLS